MIVVEVDGKVVGWASLSAWNKRAAYANSVEASVYVREDEQRAASAGRCWWPSLIADDCSAITC